MGLATRRAHYREVQNYGPYDGTGLFAWNDAGHLWQAGEFPGLNGLSALDSNKALRAFKRETVVNTFGMASSDLGVLSLENLHEKTGFYIRADSDEVSGATAN